MLTYFLVCATVFIPLIPIRRWVYIFFPPPPLFDWRVLFVSYLSYTERGQRWTGGKNRIDENAIFLRSSFTFSFFLLLQYLYLSDILNAPLGASGLRHHSHRLGLFLTIFFWTHTILVVIINWQTCWFDMSNPLWDVKEAGKMGV